MNRPLYCLIVLFLLLTACGVPQEALSEAQRQAWVLQQPPSSDAEVQKALLDQAAAWEHFEQKLQERQWGGIRTPEADFLQLVQRNHAIAQRTAVLINNHQDNPATNRQMLQEFAQRWQQSASYLSK